ncbi:MAG TPA: hypothetical protein GYA06_11815 [Chloroflexi bacterium]|jgi:hypothetical protein|nr:hypothetical protein [Chloroflexota bacterium]HOJ85204.1 hypothetical protein [Bacillota bacterium]
MQQIPSNVNQNTIDYHAATNQRLERMAWGLFLIILGGLALVPDRWVPEGAWLVGAGLVMLGLNAARFVLHIKVSGFTVVLGMIALLSGMGSMFGVNLPVFPILLILAGVYLILRPYLENRFE